MASAAVVVARTHSRSPRRARRARVSNDGSRQVPRRDQGGTGSRAPCRTRRARHRRSARSRRPEAVARDGGFTRDGVDRELDELTTISRSGKQVIAEMENRERARTGIASLKVRYNRVFGYYIEVSKTHLRAVPA